MSTFERRGQMNSYELLHKAADALELAATGSIWDDLVSHMGRALNVDWAFVAKLLPDTDTTLRTLAAWHRGKLIQNFEYQLDVPFEDLRPQDVCLRISDARKHLRNAWLKRVRAEAFGQIKLIGSLGQARGILGIAHPQPLERAHGIESTLRIFAFKATVELERELADERFYRQLLETIR
jgi:hypothetical protein